MPGEAARPRRAPIGCGHLDIRLNGSPARAARPQILVDRRAEHPAQVGASDPDIQQFMIGHAIPFSRGHVVPRHFRNPAAGAKGHPASPLLRARTAVAAGAGRFGSSHLASM